MVTVLMEYTRIQKYLGQCPGSSTLFIFFTILRHRCVYLLHTRIRLNAFILYNRIIALMRVCFVCVKFYCSRSLFVFFLRIRHSVLFNGKFFGFSNDEIKPNVVQEFDKEIFVIFMIKTAEKKVYETFIVYYLGVFEFVVSIFIWKWNPLLLFVYGERQYDDTFLVHRKNVSSSKCYFPSIWITRGL